MTNGSEMRKTFIVQVISQQQDAIQGTITWAASGETQSFRSAMELLNLVDSAKESVTRIPLDETKTG